MASESDSDFEIGTGAGKGKRQAVKLTQEEVDELVSKTFEIVENDLRRVYLITYSNADKKLFPTKKSFAKACEEAFGGGKRVSFYAACEETHQDGRPHYHVSIKLTQGQRWGTAKGRLLDKGAVVHFSEGPPHVDGKYAWAYRYVCKSHPSPCHTPNHPQLQKICSDAHKTQAATSAKKRKFEEKKQKGGDEKKSKKLRTEDVADYCRKNSIKTLNELLADAETRHVNGDNTLRSFIFSRSMKGLSDMLDMTWRMSNAVAIIHNLKRPRMEVLKEAAEADCDPKCNGL